MEDAKWFVVHTYSGYENKVADNIKTVVENRKMQDQILDVKVPIIEEEIGNDDASSDSDDSIVNETASEKKAGKKKAVKTVKRKIYPGYVFVKMGISYDERSDEMKMTDEAWYIVRNTRGVTGFVGPESKPRPLSETEVYEMGIENDAYNKVVEVDYSVGDTVVIIGGAFDGHIGKVEFIDIPNDTVRVTIEMMGRDIPCELGLDQVELDKD